MCTNSVWEIAMAAALVLSSVQCHSAADVFLEEI